MFVFCRCDVYRGRRPRQRATRFGITEESPLPPPSEKLPMHSEEMHSDRLIIHGHAQIQDTICAIRLV